MKVLIPAGVNLDLSTILQLFVTAAKAAKPSMKTMGSE